MIFLHTEKEPVHDYVRQALFLPSFYRAYLHFCAIME